MLYFLQIFNVYHINLNPDICWRTNKNFTNVDLFLQINWLNSSCAKYFYFIFIIKIIVFSVHFLPKERLCMSLHFIHWRSRNKPYLILVVRLSVRRERFRTCCCSLFTAKRQHRLRRYLFSPLYMLSELLYVFWKNNGDRP